MYFIVEPNIKEHHVFKLTNVTDAIENADILVFLVAHNEFKNVKISSDKVILDFCGVTNK
jgi:UDP-N-acetyl-D-mannosaminuronic acid dehydrogenase